MGLPQMDTYTDYTGQSVSFLLGLQASGAMSAKTLHNSQGFAAPAIISMIIGSGCQSQEPSPLPLFNFTLVSLLSLKIERKKKLMSEGGGTSL